MYKSEACNHHLPWSNQNVICFSCFIELETVDLTPNSFILNNVFILWKLSRASISKTQTVIQRKCKVKKENMENTLPPAPNPSGKGYQWHFALA